MHLALARKYRPQNFLQVIGQDPVVKTLQNAIESDRLHHAYLFAGVRGVGKTSMARILAKSINCEQGPTMTPCQECVSCQSITQSNSLDVIEIDGASNNLVDDVRELREQVKYLPTNSKYKIIIIDEVHMLSNSAFNALLKTLEEPPAHVIFIFATTESHKIPITILSRCQKYDFRKVNTPVLIKLLQEIIKKEKIKIDPEAIHLVTQCAQGSVRDALSLLDQIYSSGHDLVSESHVREILGLADRVILQETFATIIQEDLNASLETLNQIDERGLDLKLFAEGLLQQFRHLILLESTKNLPPDLSPSEADFFKSLQSKVGLSLLLAQYQILFRGIQELSYSEFQKTTLEILFVKLNQTRNMIDLTDLVDKIKNKKSQVKAQIPNSNYQIVRQAHHSDNPEQSRRKNSKSQSTNTNKLATTWHDLVKWITNEKPPLGSLLKEVVPVSFSDQKIEIALSPNSQTKDILIERVSIIKEMIHKHFGKAVEFSISDLTAEKKKPSH